MIAVLAALAFQASSPQATEPEFFVSAATAYCEPFVLRALSRSEAETRLLADGYIRLPQLESDEEPFLPEGAFEVVRFQGPDDAVVTLTTMRDRRYCRTGRPGAVNETREIDRAIEGAGDWLLIPPQRDDRTKRWLSRDARLTLVSGPSELGDRGRTGVMIAAAEHSPEIMIAQRNATIAGERRSPAEAVIHAIDHVCPMVSSPNFEPAAIFMYEAEFALVGSPALLRNRDPRTNVGLVERFPCVLAVRGAGRPQAETDLRAWLGREGSEWTPAARADVWTRGDRTVQLLIEDDLLYVAVDEP